MASQNTVILEWLLSGKPLTSDLAFSHCNGTRRLASRIHDLRLRGWKISNQERQIPLVGGKARACVIYRIDPKDQRA